MRAMIVLLAAILVALAAVFALDGRSSVGRLALRLGFPAVAENFLDDAVWKGIAYYRGGDHDGAVASLRSAGPSGYFHRANALARLERYEEAQAILDAHLFRYPEDEDARHNRALIGELYKVVGEAGDGKYGMPVALQTEQGDADGVVAATKAVEQRVRHVFDDQVVVASPQWLATLADEPGRFMRARIAAEHERRLLLGISPGLMESPW